MDLLSHLNKKYPSFLSDIHSSKDQGFRYQDSIKSIANYHFNAIVVGSDQVWRTKNTVLVGDNFFLDFIDSHQTTKIAYAASFGIDEWLEDAQKTLKIKSLLDDFQYISVRESSGIDICKNNFNIDVDRLIDPTLLLVKEQYNELLNNQGRSFKSPTLVNYILDYDANKREIINHIAKEQSLNVFDLYPKKKKLWNYYKSVETWLSAFRDADFVVTDSFHGTVFSIIYNKPFITIANKERGLTRFLSILNLLGLTSRLVYSLEDVISNHLLQEKMDFNQANRIIKEEKDRSVSMFKKYITKRH